MTRVLSLNYTQPGTNFPRTDSDTDAYEVDELQVLSAAVEAHDHSAGRGLAAQRLGSGVVQQANVANDAIGFNELSDHASTDALRAVGSNHIRDGVVLSRHIASAQILATHLGVGASLGLVFPRAYAGYVVNSQSPVTATLTAVAFSAADIYDTAAMHSPTVNNTRMTIPTNGWYQLYGFAKFAPNATGSREIYFRLTRAAVPTFLQTAHAQPGQATQPTMISLAAPYELLAADFIELIVYQSSGAGLVLSDAGFGVTSFGI